MGLRRITVHYAMGKEPRLRTSIHDEYVLDCPLV